MIFFLILIIIIAVGYAIVYKFYLQNYFLAKKRPYYIKIADKTGLKYCEKKLFLWSEQYIEGVIDDYSYRIFQKDEGYESYSETCIYIFVKGVPFRSSFTIRKEHLFNKIAKAIGWNDIEFGEEYLDKTFNFKSNDENWFRELMTPKFRNKLLQTASHFNGELINNFNSFKYRTKGYIDNDKAVSEINAIVNLMATLLK